MSITWTPEELEALRLADEEIEAEFDDDTYFVTDPEHRALDAELDKLARDDSLSRKERILKERRRQYLQKYYQVNRPRILEQKKAYQKRTRSQRKIWELKYRAEHSDDLRAQAKAYRQVHLEAIRAYDRARAAENREANAIKFHAWYLKNQDVVRQKSAQYAQEHKIEIRAREAKAYKVKTALQRLQKRDGSG